MLKLTNSHGKEFRFGGVYRKPANGEYFLDNSGDILRNEYGPDMFSVRAIVTPVTNRHIFGGVIFEELPVQRLSHHGEYFLGVQNQVLTHCGNWESTVPVTILKPIAIEGVQ